MSVTFWFPDAPTLDVPCPYCAEQDNGERCDRYCPGTVRQSTAPELNVANGTAAAMAGAMGLDDVYGGSVSPADAPAVLRSVLRALNVDARIEAQTYEGGVERGQGGATIFTAPMDADRIRDRLEKLRDLLVYCADSGYTLHWG